jgi:thymidylate synthase
MKIFEGNTVGEVYSQVVKELLKQPDVGNTKEINNCIVVVNNPTLKTEIEFPYRKTLSEKYANAELRWYWSGDNSCHTIGQYAKMWLRLTDDGETNNSAYGYILFKKYGFNQLEQIIELLQKDSTTRRAVLNISDPAINRITTKDMQCTIALDFLIRDGKLEETVVMRSNDIVKGFTYDYIFFVSIGEYIAKRLGLKLSVYTHHAISMHLYHSDIGTFINVPESDEITHDKYLINADEIIKECYDYEKNNTN